VRLRAPALLLLLLLGLLAVPASASAEADRNWLVPNVIVVEHLDTLPTGFHVTARQAVRAAEADPRVQRELARWPKLERSVEIPTYVPGRRYAIGWGRGDRRMVEVHVDGDSGRVKEVWTGLQVDWILARGYDPPVGGSILNKGYVWVPLCLLFIAPFFDPRRPFRLLHLDLLMLLGFSASVFFLNRGNIDLSVPLVYPFLGYLLVRLLLAGFRPRPRRGPLVPLMPTAVMAVLLVGLVGGRIALNLTDSTVIDVGFASVIGADRISHGQELYVDNDIHGDTYGPLTYIAYVPFEAIFPFKNDIVHVPAAQAAAITFDLLALFGLFLLGGRLREGPEGRRLGLAFAFAWAAYPFSTYALQSNTNDAFLAALLVCALLALNSPPARGAIVGLGAVAKFVPLALAPLFAAGHGDRRPSTVLRFGAVLALVIVATLGVYMPDGGLREFWNSTLGFQMSRTSPFALWGLHPELDPIKTVLTGFTGLLAAALFFVPKRRDTRQVAALAGAVIVALQITANHWFYLYLLWIAPLAFVTMFCAYGPEPEPETAAEPVERAREPALA
jgi:Glycosyltransferase family 87